MSMKLCCCLCCTPCKEYQTLQNDLGECNEIYEVTVKYFDPMLLAEYFGTMCVKDKRILCQNCWLHIETFHAFNQTVFEARAALENTSTHELPTHIKLEEEQFSVALNGQHRETVGEDYLKKCNNEYIKNYMEDEKDPIESDTEVIHYSNDGNESDSTPLIELLKSQKSLKEDKTSGSEKEDKEIELDKPKTFSTQKSKELSQEFSKLDPKEDNPLETKRKSYDNSKEPTSHPALEKFRKHNEFIAEWKSQLECDLCNETFSNFDLLKIHFKDNHKTRCYVKCCERKFGRRCGLVEHIRLHINPEIHKCDICGKPNSSRYNLKIHKRTIHEGQGHQFKCNLCSKVFKQKQNLERHLLTHVEGSKDFKCHQCDKAYVLEVQLKTHIKMVHNDDRICDLCGKTLHGIGQLKKHLQEHAGVEKPKYPCDECDSVLTCRMGLKRHKEAFHSDGSTVYVCSICGKVSGSERGLINHRKFVHEKERIHKCPHCEKAFKRPKNLQEHIASHTGEALYECPHCPTTFKMNSKYYQHLKTVHPVEWDKSRKNRLEKQKIDFQQVTNQIVL